MRACGGTGWIVPLFDEWVLLPAYNALVEASLATAGPHDYAGVPVRVADAEGRSSIDTAR